MPTLVLKHRNGTYYAGYDRHRYNLQLVADRKRAWEYDSRLQIRHSVKEEDRHLFKVMEIEEKEIPWEEIL